MQSQIHFTVAAVVCRDGRYLMVLEDIDGQLVLNQPAGHAEPGESALEAVCRETLEETGWRVAPTACLGLACYVAPDGGTFHRCVILCDPVAEVTGELHPEIHSRLWLPAERILDHSYRHRSPMVRGAVQDHLAGRRFPLALLRDYR
ncbi:MAG: NUDIX domain-containing protein [Pseudomonadota bacterium]|jgi:8-oxo-dGTP pyrophosphatase MutT (NUDIX family)